MSERWYNWAPDFAAESANLIYHDHEPAMYM
jgi:hypothetical protein